MPDQDLDCMSRDEAITMLQAGHVKAWNDHRHANPTWRPDLEGADLSGANLKFADLTHTRLADANLGGADLLRARFNHADLRRAALHNANLEGAQLNHAELSEAKLIEANLKQAALRESHLAAADLARTDLTNATLPQAIMRNATLDNAKLTGADLTGVDLSNACLTSADLGRATLSGAILRSADLSKANLRRARAKGVDCSGANLKRAKLTGADLVGARFEGADLRHCVGLRLDGQNIKRARFSRSQREPYCILRRTYTGARQTVILCILGALVLPYLLMVTVGGGFENQLLQWLLLTPTTIVALYSLFRIVVAIRVSRFRAQQRLSGHAPRWRAYGPWYALHGNVLKPMFWVALLCGVVSAAVVIGTAMEWLGM